MMGEVKEHRDGADLSAFKWPLGGYAPGNYMGGCIHCGDTLVNVDKRASSCLACALAATRPSRDEQAVGEGLVAVCRRELDYVYNLEPAVWHMSYNRKIDRKSAAGAIERILTALRAAKPADDTALALMPRAIVASAAFNHGCHKSTADAIAAGDYEGRRIDATIAVEAVAAVQQAALATRPSWDEQAVGEGLDEITATFARRASLHQSCTHPPSKAETAAALGEFVSEHSHTIIHALTALRAAKRADDVGPLEAFRIFVGSLAQPFRRRRHEP